MEIRCSSCAAVLRVSDEHVNRNTRCPNCGTIQVVTLGTSSPAAGPEDTAYGDLPEPAGQTPVVSPPHEPNSDEALPREESADVRNTDSLSAGFDRQAALENQSENDTANQSSVGLTEDYRNASEPNSGTGTPLSPPTQADIREEFRRNLQRKHRGVLIITIAIVGLGCTCPILSILAWLMGSNDLRKMNAGEIDPAGRDVTRIGYYMGMGASLLWITLAFLITVGLLIRPGG